MASFQLLLKLLFPCKISKLRYITALLEALPSSSLAWRALNLFVNSKSSGGTRAFLLVQRVVSFQPSFDFGFLKT